MSLPLRKFQDSSGLHPNIACSTATTMNRHNTHVMRRKTNGWVMLYHNKDAAAVRSGFQAVRIALFDNVNAVLTVRWRRSFGQRIQGRSLGWRPKASCTDACTAGHSHRAGV